MARCYSPARNCSGPTPHAEILPRPGEVRQNSKKHAGAIDALSVIFLARTFLGTAKHHDLVKVIEVAGPRFIASRSAGINCTLPPQSKMLFAGNQEMQAPMALARRF